MTMIQITYAKLTEAGRIDGGTYEIRRAEIDADDVEAVCNDPASNLDVPTDLIDAGYVIVGAEAK